MSRFAEGKITPNNIPGHQMAKLTRKITEDDQQRPLFALLVISFTE